ncbi:MAG: hypothetical protein L6R39_007413 [Caloplaca ligustica]|nr:MAG: hypothetical protein L6R39_007413 [Caloplaca ligustica]
MGLVGYSDSEDSDVEEKPVTTEPPNAVLKASKPSFQKVVDRSDPHKIRVTLPEIVKQPDQAEQDGDEPPAKKARTGGGGFNSFLPAPKRQAAVNGAAGGAGLRRGGLGSGVNLKTGAAPGFSREAMVAHSQDEGEGTETTDGKNSLQADGSRPENASPEKATLFAPSEPPSVEAPREEPKKEGNPMVFKPLSVARKPQKKKSTAPSGDAVPKPKANPPPVPPQAAPKISLFSAELPQDSDENGNTSSDTYTPIIYRANLPEPSSTEPPPSTNPYIAADEASFQLPPEANATPGPQSLDTIASDLNLSASAKRQLFGRQKPHASSSSAITIVNFNTDQEYAANELLRQAGEQVQHNPVRAIAPGKHSLKQLVNAASNQKDALEEQFASGRRNKKEAGSKYGW